MPQTSTSTRHSDSPSEPASQRFHWRASLWVSSPPQSLTRDSPNPHYHSNGHIARSGVSIPMVTNTNVRFSHIRQSNVPYLNEKSLVKIFTSKRTTMYNQQSCLSYGRRPLNHDVQHSLWQLNCCKCRTEASHAQTQIIVLFRTALLQS